MTQYILMLRWLLTMRSAQQDIVSNEEESSESISILILRTNGFLKLVTTWRWI